MADSLRTLAENRGLPFIEDFDAVHLAPEAYTDEKIFRLLDRYAESYGEGLVLYGGLTATERVFGLKRIREITTDLDFVCSDRGLEAVLEGERVRYLAKYDILYTVSDNVPITFSYGHIHDWRVSRDFTEKARVVCPSSVPLRCSSREYSIMLKMRRTNDRIRRGLAPFGKDALDIVNILVAPAFKPDFGRVDGEALRDLVLSEVTADKARIGSILRFVAGYRIHLNEAEFAAFAPIFRGIGELFGL